MYPSLPDNFNKLDETEQSAERELYRRRLVHYHYVENTEKYNKLHFAALTNPAGMFLSHLFFLARCPWLGESLELKLALIQAKEEWECPMGEGSTCPIVFDSDDIRKTKELGVELKQADKLRDEMRDAIGVGPADWVPTALYESAVTINQTFREEVLAGTETSEERAEIENHWPFDDRGEDGYR